MAAHLSSSLVQTCCRWFWYKIYWKWSWTSPAALQKHFEIEEDWEGALYCGIWLKWNYSKRCTDMKMPGHVIFSLESFKLSKSTKKQDCTKNHTHKNMEGCTIWICQSHQQLLTSQTTWHQLDPTHNWMFPLLCMSIRCKNALGMKYHCQWTSCTYRTNKTMYQTLIRLQMDPPQNYHPWWQIQHDS